jgi:hypothetical protein
LYPGHSRNLRLLHSLTRWDGSLDKQPRGLPRSDFMQLDSLRTHGRSTRRLHDRPGPCRLEWRQLYTGLQRFHCRGLQARRGNSHAGQYLDTGLRVYLQT